MSSRPSNPQVRGMLRPDPGATYRLSHWTIRRFKSVAEAEIPLKPLTVLLGPNSAGKSSLIQSILVFVQAQASFERPDLVSLNGSMLKLGAFDEVLHAGPSLGRARSIELGGVLEEVADPRGMLPAIRRRLPRRRDQQESRPTSLSWGTTFGRPLESAPGRMQVNACWVEFTSPADEEWVDDAPPGPMSTPDVESLVPHGDARAVARVELKRRSQRAAEERLLSPPPVLSGRFPTTRLDSGGAVIHRYRGSLKREGAARATPIAAGSPQSSLPGVAYREVALATLLSSDQERRMWRRNLPARGMRSRTATREGRSEEPLDLEAAVLLGGDILERWWARLAKRRPLSSDADVVHASVQLLYHALADIDEGVLPRLRGPVDEAAFYRALSEWVLQSGLPDAVLIQVSGAGAEYEARETIAQFLATNVHYLGPIRTTARAVSSEAQYSRGVGVEGEVTAAVLHGNWDEPTVYLRPDNEGGSVDRPRLVREPLGIAVNRWMMALELGEVRTRDQARYGLEVTVRPEGLDADLDLRNVGVGISQVLPVVVLCLRSTPGSLIMIEQPELHLHPAAQQRLADFLVAMMRSGRQLIIETHSDHLVARLRRRIAEDSADALQDGVGFLYVTRDPETAATEYREVSANIYGGLEDWPQGFFEQGPREAAELIRRALEKKKAREADGDV